MDLPAPRPRRSTGAVVALLATAAVFAVIALVGLGLAVAFGPSGFGGDAGPAAPSTTPGIVAALLSLAAAGCCPVVALLTRRVGLLAVVVAVEVVATITCWALT